MLASTIGSVVIALFCAAPLDVAGSGERTKAAVQEQQWGHIRGRFVWKGDVIPQLRVLQHAPNGIPDESLIVHPENRGIANVFVFLERERADCLPQIHPFHRNQTKEPVALTIKRGQFKPHVAVVRAGQELRLKNLDKFGYIIHVAAFSNPARNLLLHSGRSQSVILANSEKRTVQVTGTIHPWVSAWLVVADHPYVSVTDENGRFAIFFCPAGVRRFRVWHERAGWIQSVELQNVPTELKKGQMLIDLQTGANQLGDIQADSKLFER